MADAPPSDTDYYYQITCRPDHREIISYAIPDTLSTELSQICDFYLRSQLTSSRIPFDSDLLTEVLHSAEPWYPTITIPAASDPIIPNPFVNTHTGTHQPESTTNSVTSHSLSTRGVTHHPAPFPARSASPPEPD